MFNTLSRMIRTGILTEPLPPNPGAPCSTQLYRVDHGVTPLAPEMCDSQTPPIPGTLTEPLPPNPGAPCSTQLHRVDHGVTPLAPETWDSQTPPITDAQTVESLQQNLWKILGRALSIRHVDAGSCNACELEIHALNNPYYNLEGIGIKFVASPRHADLLLVTGPVSVNMEEALRRTYNAIPDPKLVVAVGECATCGGVSARSQISARSEIATHSETSTGSEIVGTSYATRGSIASIIPVNRTIAGCPPTPQAIMAGILEAIAAR